MTRATQAFTLVAIGVALAAAVGARAQYDDDAPAPKPVPKPGETAKPSCEQRKDGWATRYTASFAAGNSVGFHDAVKAFRGAGCDDAVSAAESAKLAAVVKDAPALKKGAADKALQPFAQKAIARMPSSVREQIELVTAIATADKKKLVNAAGTGMGTTRRVSLVVRVKERAACLELRGDWRVSNLDVDQDDPEYIALDAMRGDGFGWRNLSNYDFQDLTPAWLVACPRS